MTDRIKGLYVVLEDDMRPEDVSGIEIAIRLIRGVAHTNTLVADADHYMAVVQARIKLRSKLWDALEK